MTSSSLFSCFVAFSCLVGVCSAQQLIPTGTCIVERVSIVPSACDQFFSMKSKAYDCSRKLAINITTGGILYNNGAVLISSVTSPTCFTQTEQAYVYNDGGITTIIANLKDAQQQEISATVYKTGTGVNINVNGGIYTCNATYVMTSGNCWGLPLTKSPYNSSHQVTITYMSIIASIFTAFFLLCTMWY